MTYMRPIVSAGNTV